MIQINAHQTRMVKRSVRRGFAAVQHVDIFLCTTDMTFFTSSRHDHRSGGSSFPANCARSLPPARWCSNHRRMLIPRRRSSFWRRAAPRRFWASSGNHHHQERRRRPNDRGAARIRRSGHLGAGAHRRPGGSVQTTRPLLPNTFGENQLPCCSGRAVCSIVRMSWRKSPLAVISVEACCSINCSSRSAGFQLADRRSYPGDDQAICGTASVRDQNGERAGSNAHAPELAPRTVVRAFFTSLLISSACTIDPKRHRWSVGGQRSCGQQDNWREEMCLSNMGNQARQ